MTDSIQLSPDHFASKLLPKLRSERITYFPIRHHSPACAAHIRRWLLDHRPAAVLVEGPSSFNERIDLLTDDRCVCPVALYTSFVDTKGRLRKALEKGEEVEQERSTAENEPRLSKRQQEAKWLAPRFAAYYPFCDYSPELIALRTGKTVGARLRFIDQEYAEMVVTQFQAECQDTSEIARVRLLAEEPHLQHSQYIRMLARKLGCRDFNELWDHLFESCWDSLSTDAFIDRLATYCAMARLDYSTTDLRNDGTTAREACMAATICDELARGDGPILVVTGGFHTVALPDLVAQKVERPPKPHFGSDEVGVWLMRYSFDQLDSLAGYSAGMPSPAFYDRLWRIESRCDIQLNSAGRAAEFEQAAAEILVEFSRLTRERKFPNLISTADCVAAVQMTKQLAQMRGHPWPLREDVLDGIRACFVKGEVHVEGEALLNLVHEILAGNKVGAVPPECDLPPIVDDFYREAKRFRLPIAEVEKKHFTLDLYRNTNQRALSRFFHRLSALNIRFAHFVGGPDFVTGYGLDLLQEHWDVTWSPGVESGLIEAAIFGSSIEEATATKLLNEVSALEQAGQGRRSNILITILIRACRLGLHEKLSALIPLIDIHIAEDANFTSVAQALAMLELLERAREPLEASTLTALPYLLATAYQRACRLLVDVGPCPNEALDDVLRAMQVLREVVAATSRAPMPISVSLDAQLFFQALHALIKDPQQRAQSAIIGAAAGILYGEGRLSVEELALLVGGYLSGTNSDHRRTTGIVRGLLATAREVVWQLTEIIQALDAQFQSWDEKTFLDMLPELRLAFTSLTPREVSRVAERISSLHQADSLGELVFADIDESELQLGLSINFIVEQSLQSDGLV